MSLSSLSIVQLNMGRASSVSDQLLEYYQSKEVDVALVQEPNTNRGRLAGFEVAPFRCYLSKPTRRRGPQHLDYGAAIIVFNPNLVVVARDSDAIEKFVSVNMDCAADGTITMISGYFKYRVPTAVHVDVLDTLYKFTTNEVLIALDANAFSTRWYSRINDGRGETLTTWLDEQNLHTVNTHSPYTTFNGPSGRTNIDVTTCGQILLGKLRNLEVVPDVTTSDHQVITYSLQLQLREFVHRTTRFNLDRSH